MTRYATERLRCCPRLTQFIEMDELHIVNRTTQRPKRCCGECSLFLSLPPVRWPSLLATTRVVRCMHSREQLTVYLCWTIWMQNDWKPAAMWHCLRKPDGSAGYAHLPRDPYRTPLTSSHARVRFSSGLVKHNSRRR